MSPEPQILALGGHGMQPGEPLDDFLLELTGAERPRVLLIPTASAENAEYVVRFYECFGRRTRASHLRLFGIPTQGIRDVILDQDAIFVGGGNTANMLAVWRVHGVDEALREAWERGIVLAGSSAGSICWFDAGVTDSFRAELDGLECLGFLPGSNCPHYDGEETRRPAYHRLVAGGLPPGLAAEDFVGLRFRGLELAEVVTSRPGSQAYRVERVDGGVRETPLSARLLQ
ncbi:MAG TPA: peptidase E [Gaiellaceae bacterium]|nr:peptidase E [Gaiellaceae bacterium]